MDWPSRIEVKWNMWETHNQEAIKCAEMNPNFFGFEAAMSEVELALKTCHYHPHLAKPDLFWSNQYSGVFKALLLAWIGEIKSLKTIRTMTKAPVKIPKPPTMAYTNFSYRAVFEFPEGLKFRLENFCCDLSKFTIFTPQDLAHHGFAMKQKLEAKAFAETPGLDCAMGSFLGMVIGDALGAPFEFSHLRYGSTDMKEGFEPQLWKESNAHYNKFGLKPGQWTDDASMGLCIADSLLMHPEFNLLDMRLRFFNWWRYGYNNAFGYDEERTNHHSVGLGGNISMSMDELERKKPQNIKPYTEEGDSSTNGNGSIMRNTPIPIFFWRDIPQGLEAAEKQSKTTHKGKEATECCKLMTFIVAKAIQQNNKIADHKAFLSQVCSEFKTDCYALQCLAKSQPEEKHIENQGQDLRDRNWNWQSPNYSYAESRATSKPGYIGSYAMDALAMALHCVYNSISFPEALLYCVNMRGDADSVAAVCGQIAGAIFASSAIPFAWIETILKWDPMGTIPLRAHRLYYANAKQ